MNVLLLQAIPGQGRADEIIDVADAYARNFLFPKKLARPATAEVMAASVAKKLVQEHDLAQQQAALKAAKQKLDGQTVKLVAKASATGKLFAAVKEDDIIRAMQQQFSSPVQGLHLVPNHLKTSGTHQVQVSWPDGTSTVMIVAVNA